jgi:hypothetical protein
VTGVLGMSRSSTPSGSALRKHAAALGHALPVAAAGQALLGVVLGCNALSGVDDFRLVGGYAPGGKDATGATDADVAATRDSGRVTAIRLRCGVLTGSNYVDSMDHTWIDDEDFSPTDTETASNGVAVTGTADPTLYQNERYADRTAFPSGFTYRFDVSPGLYVVKLHFAETGMPDANYVGYREFDVSIDGRPVLTDFDIIAAVGWGAACVKTFSTTVAAGGALTVQFSPGAVQNPKVNDIEIVSGPPDAD